MLRWFKRWREKRELRRLALKILSDPSPSVDALIKARGIISAISERRPICRHCFEPFISKEREFAERFQVRSILMVPDSEPDPMLCDACFETVGAVFNRNATNVGTSNSGPTNLALQKLH